MLRNIGTDWFRFAAESFVCGAVLFRFASLWGYAGALWCGQGVAVYVLHVPSNAGDAFVSRALASDGWVGEHAYRRYATGSCRKEEGCDGYVIGYIGGAFPLTFNGCLAMFAVAGCKPLK